MTTETRSTREIVSSRNFADRSSSESPRGPWTLPAAYEISFGGEFWIIPHSG